MANTPVRAMRIPEATWTETLERAEVEGCSATTITIRALEAYLLTPVAEAAPAAA
jgi:hypothetical protein